MYDFPSSYGPVPGTGPVLPDFVPEGATAKGWYRGHKLANGAQRTAAAFIDYWVPVMITIAITNKFNLNGTFFFCMWGLLVFWNLAFFGDERLLATAPGSTSPNVLQGQSLGKWILGITAVQPRMWVATSEAFLIETNWRMNLLRASLHCISWPILPISLVAMCLGDRRQSFCDRATKTLVISARPQQIEGLVPPQPFTVKPEHRLPPSVHAY